MQYRIIQRTYEDGETYYCPQYKRLWAWIALAHYTAPKKSPFYFDTIEAAKYCIRQHKGQTMKYKEKVLDDNII